jgi:hypothetical protein
MMMDGSTIDLSAQSAPWNCHFTNAGGNAGGNGDNCKVAFDTGATVTIKLAGRADLDALAGSGAYVALWATDAVPDSSVNFVIDESNAKRFKLKRDNTGLKVTKIDGLRLFLK